MTLKFSGPGTPMAGVSEAGGMLLSEQVTRLEFSDMLRRLQALRLRLRYRITPATAHVVADLLYCGRSS